jgi:hypothetical protein
MPVRTSRSIPVTVAPTELSFRFSDDQLQKRLVTLLEREGSIPYRLGKDDTLFFSEQDEERMENEFINRIRDSVFADWKLLFSPNDYISVYRAYMSSHNVPFKEELFHDKVTFLMPRTYRPSSWRI